MNSNELLQIGLKFDCRISLDTLPTEIILHLSTYINVTDIIFNLSLTCKRLHSIFQNSLYWKQRCLNAYKNVEKSIYEEVTSNEVITVKKEDINMWDGYDFPPTPDAILKYDWRKTCAEREYLYDYWSRARETLYQYKYRQESSIDVVKLINGGKTCVTGSRDRSIYIYDVEKMAEDIKEEKAISYHARNVHKGWIWTLSFLNNTRFCSGGWDSCLKTWDLGQSSLEEIGAFKCESAILCSSFASPSLIALGTYHKTVRLIDPRISASDYNLKTLANFTNKNLCTPNFDSVSRSATPKNVVFKDRKMHNGPILCLTIDSERNLLITGSEDKSICVADLRQSCGGSSYEVGKMEAKPLYKIPYFDSGHAYSVRSIKHRNGLLFTCSADKSFKVFDPTFPPKLVYSHKICLEGEMASLDYKNEVLAVASADGGINVWKKKKGL
ncbi:F-box/WD repeat-containing protein 9-like isoform X2 [Gordionus sp. m RMFG-2023]|uniref:F-box/WD repeat-containing protein 9-like isoform X2 n=1 Tax=Gordionus sp. m RMFG-2023 TaxID=3053472 RepID=UPI0031FE0C79